MNELTEYYTDTGAWESEYNDENETKPDTEQTTQQSKTEENKEDKVSSPVKPKPKTLPLVE